MLTLNELAGVSGVTPQHLRNWIAEGVITPTVPGGAGRGNTHRFSLPQAVGIVVAVRAQNGPHSCAIVFVKACVAAFADVSEEWLQSRFAKGATHLATIHQGRPVLGCAEVYWRADVKAAYEAVRAKMREKAAEVEAVASGLTAR